MSTNKNNMFKDFDKLSNMKNMLNVSLIDILIPEIKSNKNENVIKMLDIVKDKPDIYLNLLIVAIFHKNLKIVELIIEKYFTTEIEEPYINTHFLYNAILPENSKNKLTDSKSNYSEEICPYAVMAGIGGDIEIFKLLYKKNLINNYNINNSGIIGLSKKYKNVFFSNIVGACAYYGNENLLEYILDNYRSKLDININTTEKKTKNSKIHFSKEFSDFPPVLLGVGGFLSDKKTVEMLKIFEEYKANFEIKDFNDNNIIHIATKEKKILSLKFLVESLGLKNIINEENINNETPYTIAKQSKNKEIIDFFDSYIKQDENTIKKNLEELINEDNKKKNNKKNKKHKNNKDNFNLFNSSEYQETLGSVQEKKEKTNEENNEEIKEENNIDSIEEEEKEKEETNDKNNNEYNEKKKIKFSNKKNNYYGKNNSKNNNDIYNTYNTYNIYNNYTSDNQYYKYNSKSYYNNMKYNDKYNENNNNNYNYQYSSDYKNKYNKGKSHNNDYYNNDYNYNTKESWENRKSQKGKYNNKNNWNNDNNYNNNYYYKEKSYAIEINDDNNNKNINNNVEKNNLVEYNEIKKEQEKEETIENINNNIKINDKENIVQDDNNNKNDKEKEKEEVEEEEEEEYSYSEEEFLTQSEKKEEKKEEKTIKKSEYDNLYKKYFDAERKVNNLEKEKMELKKCIKKLYLNNNKQYIPNEENNINSLLNLANNELEKKDEIINKLKEKTKMADLSDIKNFQKDKLKEYKNFYNKNLKIINDMLKQFEKL